MFTAPMELTLTAAERADLERVKVWSDDIALFIGTAQVAGNKYLRAETGAKAMSDYFRGLVDAYPIDMEQAGVEVLGEPGQLVGVG